MFCPMAFGGTKSPWNMPYWAAGIRKKFPVGAPLADELPLVVLEVAIDGGGGGQLVRGATNPPFVKFKFKVG